MPDSLADGRTRVYWVPSIASQAAPTVAELNAGTALQDLMTPDGLEGFEASTAKVDNSSLGSTFDTGVPGRASYDGTLLRLKKQTGTDTVYNFFVRDVVGFVVIRRSLDKNTAWASTQKVEVYPAQTGETRLLKPEGNSVEKYEVPTMVTATPSLRATVA